MLDSRAEGSLFIHKAISLKNDSKENARKLREKAKRKRLSNPSSPEEQLIKEKSKFLSKSKLKSNSWIHNNLTELKKDNKSLIMPERFANVSLYAELWKLGHKDSSIDSLMRCGVPYRHIIKQVGDERLVYPVKHKCNNRTCLSCAVVRKNRLKKKYLPYLKSFKRTAEFDFHFLNISPKNYNSLEEGYSEINRTFHKFIRRKYFKTRFKWGIWVIEFKENWAGKPQYDRGTGNFLYYHDKRSWNIHIHLLYYGKKLDNVIRGKCLECGQNALSYDESKGGYYCKNSKCNSTKVVVKHKDSKLVREWKASSNNQDVYIFVSPDIKDKDKNLKKNLNYLLKYVSIDKSDLFNDKSRAEFIHFIHNKRLLNKFGSLKEIEHKPIEEVKKKHFTTKEGLKINYLNTPISDEEWINYFERGFE